jgi:5-hydroxyisourate hydrolase-like protein (transthyretin family)
MPFLSFRIPVIIRFLSIFVLLAVSTTSCGDLISDIEKAIKQLSEQRYPVPTNLQGRWTRMDTGEDIYLAGESRYEVESTAENQIAFEDDIPVLAIRNGSRNNTVTGMVTFPIPSGQSSVTPAVNVEVRAVNLNNSQEQSTTTTDTEGRFTFTELQSSDYQITASHENLNGQTWVTITETTDIGLISLEEKELWNFKAVAEYPYMFAEKESYKVKVKLHNTGNTDALAVSFTVSEENGLIEVLKPDSKGAIVGTVEANSSRQIELTVQTDYWHNHSFTGYYKDVKLHYEFRDVQNKTWKDYTILRIYRKHISIHTRALNSNLHGFLILDNHELIRIDGQKLSFKVPFSPHSDYKMVLTNSSLEGETTYSIGVGAYPFLDGPMTNFIGTSMFEPNESEAQSVTLPPERTIAYMHKGDIDFYRIDMKTDHFPGNTALKYRDECLQDIFGINCIVTSLNKKNGKLYGSFLPELYPDLGNTVLDYQYDASGEACILTETSLSCKSHDKTDTVEGLSNPQSPMYSYGFTEEACVLDDNGLHCVDIGDNSALKNIPLGLVSPHSIIINKEYGCLIDGNNLHCWGDSPPVSFVSLSNPHSLVAMNDYVCLLDDNGIHCWGSKAPDTTNVVSPYLLARYTYHICTAHSNGVDCWNSKGNTAMSSSTIQSGVTSISDSAASSFSFACATVAGSIECFGNDALSELPTGLTNPGNPISVHAFACVEDNSILKCWGSSSTIGVFNGYSLLDKSIIGISKSSVVMIILGESIEILSGYSGISYDSSYLNEGFPNITSHNPKFYGLYSGRLCFTTNREPVCTDDNSYLHHKDDVHIPIAKNASFEQFYWRFFWTWNTLNDWKQPED